MSLCFYFSSSRIKALRYLGLQFSQAAPYFGFFETGTCVAQTDLYVAEDDSDELLVFLPIHIQVFHNILHL